MKRQVELVKVLIHPVGSGPLDTFCELEEASLLIQEASLVLLQNSRMDERWNIFKTTKRVQLPSFDVAREN